MSASSDGKRNKKKGMLCTAVNCCNYSNDRKDLSFFSFPVQEERLVVVLVVVVSVMNDFVGIIMLYCQLPSMVLVCTIVKMELVAVVTKSSCW